MMTARSHTKAVITFIGEKFLMWVTFDRKSFYQKGTESKRGIQFYFVEEIYEERN